MRSIIYILGISIMFCFNSCSQNLKKISESEVSKSDLQIAQDFATNYLTKLRNGEYYHFENEAIDEFKNQLNEENQKAIYQNLKNEFGDFQSLAYSET